MTIEMKKVWFDGEKVVTQNILESDIYKRPWDIASCKAYAEQLRDKNRANRAEHAAEAIEYLLALAQPEQEPVAWVYPEGLEALKAGKPWTAYGTRQEPNNTALYLSPQPDIAPYAWVTFTPYGDEDDVWYENPEGQLLEGWTYKPLYDTTPPQRTWAGLTNGEMIELSEMKLGSWDLILEVEDKLRSKNT